MSSHQLIGAAAFLFSICCLAVALRGTARDLIEAIRKAWIAGSARYYQVRQQQRRRHMPDPLAK